MRKANAGLSLKIESDVGATFQKLTNGEISWMIAGYDEAFKVLTVKGQGSAKGGMPELLANLNDNEACWCCFKVVGVDPQGTKTSRREKFIFLRYLPENFSAMKKAKVGRHKGDVKAVINIASIDFEIDSKSELTEDVVIQKLRTSGGAHQPSFYEFQDYSEPE